VWEPYSIETAEEDEGSTPLPPGLFTLVGNFYRGWGRFWRRGRAPMKSIEVSSIPTISLAEYLRRIHSRTVEIIYKIYVSS
jgi:hypothetical protein